MLLETFGLTKTFRTGRLRKRLTRAVAGADFGIEPGETVGIVGKSGAGKTTLAMMLSGLMAPDDGKILLEGVDLWSLPQRERRRRFLRVQMIFQHPEGSFNPRWTLRRSLLEPFRLQGGSPCEGDLARHLERVGLGTEILSRRPAQASGGELQRLALARALVLAPSVLVLDEPTSMLDALTQARIIRLLQAIQRRSSVACVLISHDVDLVRLVCDRVLELEGGLLRPATP